MSSRGQRGEFIGGANVLMWKEQLFSLDLPDLVGIVGVGFILVSYGLLQARKLTVDTVAYSGINLLGSLLILVSLLYHWNTASFVIEVAWIAISLWGLMKACRRCTV